MAVVYNLQLIIVRPTRKCIYNDIAVLLIKEEGQVYKGEGSGISRMLRQCY